MYKVIKYVVMDILKNRFTLVYALCLLALSFGLFAMDENASKATLSMLNIVLLFVPLVALIFTTIYYYNSIDFIILVMAQPIRRRQIFYSIFIGISLSLTAAFVIGTGIPVLLLSPSLASLSIIIAGVALTMIFCSLSLLFSVWFRDKAKGMGISLIVWIFFMLIYDGLLLFLMFSFADYPLEKLFISLTFLNPIDLARIFALLKLDVSALMGVTGAVFKEFFGSGLGVFLTSFMLLLWFAAPVYFAGRHFRKKDF